MIGFLRPILTDGGFFSGILSFCLMYLWLALPMNLLGFIVVGAFLLSLFWRWGNIELDAYERVKRSGELTLVPAF